MDAKSNENPALPAFEQGLNQLCGDALTGGVPFATIVALLEVSKLDVVDLWCQQVRQGDVSPQMKEPLIVPFRGVTPPPNGG